MKSSVLCLSVAFTSFAFGIVLTLLIDSKPVYEISKQAHFTPDQSSLRTSEANPDGWKNGRFVYPDPLYSFPTAGAYFSTKESGIGNSVFQFTFPSNRSAGFIGRLDGNGTGIEEIKFDAVEIDIEGRSITLRTRSLLGHQYVFNGHFSDMSYLESEYNRQVVLRGTLQKRIMGRIISEEYFEFWYGVGC
jgi:hypothetical protein